MQYPYREKKILQRREMLNKNGSFSSREQSYSTRKVSQNRKFFEIFLIELKKFFQRREKYTTALSIHSKNV